MFLGISLVWKEVERKTVYTILSKPISRWMFVLGKYLGMMMTLAVVVGIMMVVYTLLLTIQQSLPPAVVYVSAGLLMVEAPCSSPSWATLFSTYSAPTTAMAFTLAIFVIGHLADDIWVYGNQVPREAGCCARALLGAPELRDVQHSQPGSARASHPVGSGGQRNSLRTLLHRNSPGAGHVGV